MNDDEQYYNDLEERMNAPSDDDEDSFIARNIRLRQ